MQFLRGRSGWDKALVLIVGASATVFGGILADWRDDLTGQGGASGVLISPNPSRDLAHRYRGKNPRHLATIAPIEIKAIGASATQP